MWKASVLGMKRIGALFILFSLLTLLLSGCWNRRELNELAIAVAAGVDRVDDRYRLSVQVVVPGQVASRKAGGNQAPATLYTAEGDTIFEAARRMTQVSPRRIYFSHLRMFLIGESMAKAGIAKILDFLMRDHEFRTDFYLVATKGATAEDTLKIMTPLESIPANKLYNSLQTSERVWSPSITVTLDELINDLSSEGKHPILTGLEISGDREAGETSENVNSIKTPANLRFVGLAIFKVDKLIGWLNEKESRGYRYIIGGVKGSVAFVPCGDKGKVTMETVRSHTKVTGKVIGSQPEIEIKAYVEGNVGAVECKGLDLTQTNTIEELESKMEKKAEQLMKSVIAKVQEEYKVDIFGFGEAIRRSHPGFWKRNKEEWNDRYFPELAVRIKVDYRIRRTGTLNNSFINDIKE